MLAVGVLFKLVIGTVRSAQPTSFRSSFRVFLLMCNAEHRAPLLRRHPLDKCLHINT
jgi:hypothetical protein